MSKSNLIMDSVQNKFNMEQSTLVSSNKNKFDCFVTSSQFVNQNQTSTNLYDLNKIPNYNLNNYLHKYQNYQQYRYNKIINNYEDKIQSIIFIIIFLYQYNCIVYI